jgi:hypothetical protein
MLCCWMSGLLCFERSYGLQNIETTHSSVQHGIQEDWNHPLSEFLARELFLSSGEMILKCLLITLAVQRLQLNQVFHLHH